MVRCSHNALEDDDSSRTRRGRPGRIDSLEDDDSSKLDVLKLLNLEDNESATITRVLNAADVLDTATLHSELLDKLAVHFGPDLQA
jgi:hypothetical protein